MKCTRPTARCLPARTPTRVLSKRFQRHTIPFGAGIAWFVLLVVAAAGQESPSIPRDALPEALPLDTIPLGLPQDRPVPADNSLTKQRVALGRRLFFDPLLSADRSLACASCHDPAHAFATTKAVAVGIGGKRGTRNAPVLLNRAYGKSFFWDGRARSLEEQALLPIENPMELGNTLTKVLDDLRADPVYRDRFQAAFDDGVTAPNLARALAGFQRVLLSGNSRVDRFQAGEYSALADGARRGLWLFESRGQCWRCHTGGNYTDEAFHNTGVGWDRDPPDRGRSRITKQERDRGRFKTPTLRDVAQSGPYMHGGSLATLEDVVAFYNRGGQKNPNLDPMLAPLNLTQQERRDLVEFLEALSGSGP